MKGMPGCEINEINSFGVVISLFLYVSHCLIAREIKPFPKHKQMMAPIMWVTSKIFTMHTTKQLAQ